MKEKIQLLSKCNGNSYKTEEELVEMMEDASIYMGAFLNALGFDWENDPNMEDTPMRVAKSFVKDLYKGVYTRPPKITAFDNQDNYDGMVFCGGIDVKSSCSHHMLPFIGTAHVAYIPGSKIIGLSKLNRTVEWFSQRPQVQENLTMQIHDYINSVCKGNNGVAVVIEAKHMCSCVRGVKHDSTMMTSKLSGAFREIPETRDEFYRFISQL